MVLPANDQHTVQHDSAEDGILLLVILVVPDQPCKDQREQLCRLLHGRVELPPALLHGLRLAISLGHGQLHTHRLRVLQALAGHAVDHAPDLDTVATPQTPLREGLLNHGTGRYDATVEQHIQCDLQALARVAPELEDAAHDSRSIAMRLVFVSGLQLCEDLLVPVQHLVHVRGRLRALLQQGCCEELDHRVERPRCGRGLAQLCFFVFSLCIADLRHGCHSLFRWFFLFLHMQRRLYNLWRTCRLVGGGDLGGQFLLLHLVLLLDLRLCGALALRVLHPLGRRRAFLGLLAVALGALRCGPLLCAGAALGLCPRPLLLGLCPQEPVAIPERLLRVRVLDANQAKHPGKLWLRLHRQAAGRERLRGHVHLHRLGQPVPQVLVEGQPLEALQRLPEEALRLHRNVLACEESPVRAVVAVHEVKGKGLRQDLQALLVQVRGLLEEH
mmetsp:Transcript_18783/g.51753  ORF Transcript_18783/g.51753 Transcript_18783/m.51753 type:complete len:444 (-) Transcript_18783:1304-2635(-)